MKIEAHSCLWVLRLLQTEVQNKWWFRFVAFRMLNMLRSPPGEDGQSQPTTNRVGFTSMLRVKQLSCLSLPLMITWIYELSPMPLTNPDLLEPFQLSVSTIPPHLTWPTTVSWLYPEQLILKRTIVCRHVVRKDTRPVVELRRRTVSGLATVWVM